MNVLAASAGGWSASAAWIATSAGSSRTSAPGESATTLMEGETLTL